MLYCCPPDVIAMVPPAPVASAIGNNGVFLPSKLTVLVVALAPNNLFVANPAIPPPPIIVVNIGICVEISCATNAPKFPFLNESANEISGE